MIHSLHRGAIGITERIFHSDGGCAAANSRVIRRRLGSAGLFAAAIGITLIGCSRQAHQPAIGFTRVPLADSGGPDRTDIIAGTVKNAVPGQRIVLYALANRWYVQPLVETPFTAIRADNTWTSKTHLGSEYAALLVEPGYQPALQLDTLPVSGRGVVVVAVRAGRLRIGLEIIAAISRVMNFGGYDTWWFRTGALLLMVLTAFLIHRLRMYELTRQLNARFQERLVERTRIAQELHDTLLQGFLSASMQVDVAEDQLPDDSPAKPLLRRALQLMSQVTEEGRNVIRGLRLPYRDKDSVEDVFSMMAQELSTSDRISYGVVSDGHPRPLRPAIRDEVYRIGREALANAFKHAHASQVEVEVEYAHRQFRLLVQDNGCGIDPAVLRLGRQNHWGLPGMRKRAESIGATLKLRSRVGDGTEVELTVPGAIAYQKQTRQRMLRGPGRLQRDDAAETETKS